MFCHKERDVWGLGNKSNNFDFHGSKEFGKFWVRGHIYVILILEFLSPGLGHYLPTILPLQVLITTDPIHQYWKTEQLPLMEPRQTSERRVVSELDSRIKK